jgi:predicted nucleic acid-binding protein
MVIIDTDVLIDAGRGSADAIACLQDIEKRSTLAISVVTQMELLIGCQNKAEQRALDRFLKRF